MIMIGKVIHQAANPGREILHAAGELLNAVCQQYPGAAGEIAAGVEIRIVTNRGVLMAISGGAAPAVPGGLLLPNGGN